MASEQSTISPELRTQIILAAVSSVGESNGDSTAWQAQVRQAVTDITIMVGDRSPMAKLVDNIAAARVFRAVLIDVVKEKTSQRGFVTLRTKPGKYNKDGTEHARTERMDVKGSPGHRMAVALRDLKGHHVTIWIYMETPASGGEPVRMIAAVRDEGEASQEEIDGVAQAS